MEARHESLRRRGLSNITRKQRRTFLRNGVYRNSLEMDMFLGSMLGLEECDVCGSPRLADWSLHSSLPNLTLIPAQSSSPGLTSPARQWAARTDWSPSGPSRTVERPAVRGDTMVRGQTEPRDPVVRPAMRLPRDLIEKMPSAPTSPVTPRREHVASKLASESPVNKKTPKTVASMVRR